MILASAPALVVLLMLGLQASGDKQAQKPCDPQSTYEPRSGPGAGQKLMARFVGDWEVVKSFFPRTGEPVRMKGDCRQTMINDGRFLQSEFVFEYRGAKATGLGILGFEAESGKFTSVWVDSRATRMSLRQSREPFNGTEIVLYSQTLGDTKEARRSRTVTHLEENGGKIVHRQYALTPDGKERLMMELLMTRKAKPASPGH
jgi:uncharacterized protein DUF1579